MDLRLDSVAHDLMSSGSAEHKPDVSLSQVNDDPFSLTVFNGVSSGTLRSAPPSSGMHEPSLHQTGDLSCRAFWGERDRPVSQHYSSFLLEIAALLRTLRGGEEAEEEEEEEEEDECPP